MFNQLFVYIGFEKKERRMLKLRVRYWRWSCRWQSSAIMRPLKSGVAPMVRAAASPCSIGLRR